MKQSRGRCYYVFPWSLLLRISVVMSHEVLIKVTLEITTHSLKLSSFPITRSRRPHDFSCTWCHGLRYQRLPIFSFR